MTDNLDLAARAREAADRAPAGSLQRAAAGSVAVTCATTRTIAEARSVLDGVTPDDVREAAVALLERLLVQ
jgi:D-Tyr-tRNAtyr deacylase